MGILSLIGLLVVISWVFGFSFHIAGDFIHALIILAIVLFVLDWLRSRSV